MQHPPPTLNPTSHLRRPPLSNLKSAVKSQIQQPTIPKSTAPQQQWRWCACAFAPQPLPYTSVKAAGTGSSGRATALPSVVPQQELRSCGHTTSSPFFLVWSDLLPFPPLTQHATAAAAAAATTAVLLLSCCCCTAGRERRVQERCVPVLMCVCLCVCLRVPLLGLDFFC